MHPEPLFASKQHPIFILGILQRSGTNYLNNLLLLHPDVQSPGLVWEDFFLAHSDLLVQYRESVERRWQPQWANDINTELQPQALLRYIGNGLIDFMQAQYHVCQARRIEPAAAPAPVSLVTATPSVRNLHLFFDLFPNAAPIIIVRDGRAVVESGVRSFGWNYDEAMRMWANGARRIQDFCKQPAHQGRFLLVRYEDIYAQTRKTMSAILDFLQLDRSRFDFDAAENLGIMGSSELMSSEGRVHWKSIDKSADFNPLARASQWGPALNSRFSWIAGKNMAELGYELGSVKHQKRWNEFLDRTQGLSIRLKHACPKASAGLRWMGQRLLNVPAPPKGSSLSG